MLNLTSEISEIKCCKQNTFIKKSIICQCIVYLIEMNGNRVLDIGSITKIKYIILGNLIWKFKLTFIPRKDKFAWTVLIC